MIVVAAGDKLGCQKREAAKDRSKSKCSYSKEAAAQAAARKLQQGGCSSGDVVRRRRVHTLTKRAPALPTGCSYSLPSISRTSKNPPARALCVSEAGSHTWSTACRFKGICSTPVPPPSEHCTMCKGGKDVWRAAWTEMREGMRTRVLSV